MASIGSQLGARLHVPALPLRFLGVLALAPITLGIARLLPAEGAGLGLRLAAAAACILLLPGALVQRALQEFDLVVLDCPPLLPVADTHVIADIADRTVLVVRANSTPKQVVEQALREFDREKLFAAILNRAQPQFIPYFREVYGYYRRPSAK